MMNEKMFETNYQCIFPFILAQVVNQELYHEDFLALVLVKTQSWVLFLDKFVNAIL